MVTWECASETWCRESWDRTACEARDRNAFQSYAWGEYKRASGWMPARWAARDADGALLGLAQVLERPLPGGLTIGWSPGGPVCGFPGRSPKDIGAVLEGLGTFCRSRGRLIYVRFSSQEAFSEDLAQSWSRGFRRPRYPLSSGTTVRLDLRLSMSELLRLMRSKHRYYVNKALAEPIRWEAGNHPALVHALVRLTAEMARDKGLRLSDPDGRDLERLCRAMGQAVVLLVGHAREQPVAACLVLVYGGTSFYLKAAAGREGRASGASYAMIYKLLEHLQRRGIAEFDFGGIIPHDPAVAGVNHFKRGFGGTEVECVGEWEWAPSRWLCRLVNVAARWRGGQL
jgi:hypothetical protein